MLCNANQFWLKPLPVVKTSLTILDEKDVNCENGQTLSIFGDFCHECPLLKHSSLALTSNCSKSSNHFCPIGYDTSKICTDKVNVNITDYCRHEFSETWICPKANKGLNFEQCYHS